MKNEKALSMLEHLEKDDYTQNLIAQGDSRYILFNVNEEPENFPNYSSGLDAKLTNIALSYYSIGCTFAENAEIESALYPLEKGATILENVHGPLGNRTAYSSYFVLTSSLAYYAAHQYSKSFIVLKNIEQETTITKLVSLFLKRKYFMLSKTLVELFLSQEISDNIISTLDDDDLANSKIYTLILAKSLSSLLEFIYSGNEVWLNKSKESLNDLLELAEIDVEPSLWWVIRLFKIIIDGFYNNSLWKTVLPLLGGNDYVVSRYISALAFQDNPNVELFISQKAALPKVLKPSGAVVSLPTSGGKTRIAEISILQSLISDPSSIVLYLAPFRSLAYEIEDSISKTFRALGYDVSYLYGGPQFSKMDELIINESNIIIATAEKAKAIFRSNSEMKSRVKLVVIDEGHLIGPEERYITSEIFLEELRYQIAKNEGKMILLSAVLPNASEIAKWVAGDETNTVDSSWRPSSQRFGILEYTGKNVNITWKGNIESFNRNLLRPFTVNRKRSSYIFPNDKKQAIGATAVKLSISGSVLIFVCRKNMVLSQAREVLLAMGSEPKEHEWACIIEWTTFTLACEEAYGVNSEVYTLAKHGVLCHHSGLASEVKLSLEKLMRKGNPKIIVATSTLGQGVNIGVSTVIFSNIWYNEREQIKNSEFWNIAGRAGRSFVDREGKILFVVDASKGSSKRRKDLKLALDYFDSSNSEKAISGLLHIVEYVHRTSRVSGIEFSVLLELIAENDLSSLKEEYSDTFISLFDLIDDTLLSLNQEFESYHREDKSYWVDDYFRKSLAYVQASHFPEIKSEDVISFVKARNAGVLKLAGEPSHWGGYISSSIPLLSGLHIRREIDEIIEVVTNFRSSERGVEELVVFLMQVEEIVAMFPSHQFKSIKSISSLPESSTIRELWINGEAINSLDDKALRKYSSYFGFTLPWGINAIARMLSTLDKEEEAKEYEELAVLVQMGLPNIFSTNIYLSGIHSRTAALELSKILNPTYSELSNRKLREKIISDIDLLQGVSENTNKWISLLKENEQRTEDLTVMIQDFRLPEDITVISQTLLVKNYRDDIYLCSPDYGDVVKVQVSEELPFDTCANDDGVIFECDETGRWAMTVRNPYKKRNIFDFL